MTMTVGGPSQVWGGSKDSAQILTHADTFDPSVWVGPPAALRLRPMERAVARGEAGAKGRHAKGSSEAHDVTATGEAGAAAAGGLDSSGAPFGPFKESRWEAGGSRQGPLLVREKSRSVMPAAAGSGREGLGRQGGGLVRVSRPGLAGLDRGFEHEEPLQAEVAAAGRAALATSFGRKARGRVLHGCCGNAVGRSPAHDD
jgi:hypothetical protein